MSAVGTLFNLLGMIPLRGGYILSDGLAWLACDVVRYRRKVVMRNLAESFPGRDERELRGIAKGFYRFLADYFFETMRLGRMSEREIRKRITFENPGLIDSFSRRGVPVALMLGHYCNWEWVSSLPLHLKGGADPSQIYHPLENEAADEAFGRIRRRFGCTNVALRDTLRYLTSRRREGKATVTGFIADQAPGYASTHLWLDFLNHDTGVFTGPEKMMRRWHGAMIYCHITRPERGRYHCRFETIAADVAATGEFEPTRRYFRLLEEQIERRPEFWLWSHRRWKRPRPAAETAQT